VELLVAEVAGGDALADGKGGQGGVEWPL